MSDFPTPHTIGWHTWSGLGEDDHGNQVDTYTPPLDEPGAPRLVIGWHVPSATEPVLAGHDRVVVDVELAVPPGFTGGPHDVADLPYGPAGQFQVIGEIRTAQANPFGWNPGGVVNLQRIAG
ncbi:hypothetical protein IU447_24125 [Nocardia farcinica]|uniref:hypothetical protein n=1 Tax=Nocardia farcinica TaxID=37329 RepID=UPI001893F11D|nr:hypothetical protein [Nocardia farcinica]MBF6363208.1 hypothetical protein [Nocardia farcinica]